MAPEFLGAMLDYVDDALGGEMVSASAAVSAATQWPARTLVGDLAIKNHGAAVYKYVFDPGGIVQRVIECRHILNRRGIEQNHVSHHTRAQNSTVHDSHSTRSQRGHFSHGFFQTHGVLFANVLRENSWKRAKGAGMGFGRAERTVFSLRRRIRPHRHQGV